jgi:hypothetical protein
LTFTLVGLLFGGIGLIFFVLGVVQYRRERAFARTALTVPGTVVGFEQRRYVRRRNGRRRVSYIDHPVVEYTTQAGQPTRFTSPTGVSPRRHQQGQSITILYREDNPHDARIADSALQYRLPIIFMILGGALTLFGAFFGLLARVVLA